MNSNDILVLIGETPEKYVLDAMNVFNENSTAKHKPTAKRIVLIAAIIVTIIDKTPSDEVRQIFQKATDNSIDD